MPAAADFGGSGGGSGAVDDGAVVGAAGAAGVWGLAAGVWAGPAGACAVFGPWNDTIGSRRITPLPSLTTSALDVTV